MSLSIHPVYRLPARPRQFPARAARTLTIRLLGICAAGLIAWHAARATTAAAEVSTPEAEGRALAAQLIGAGQKPPEDFSARGLFTIRERSGKRAEFPVTFAVRVNPSDWHVIYEVRADTPPAYEKLTVVHSDHGQSNQYWLVRSASPTNGTAAPIVIPPEQTMIPFAGSDFWLFDLGLEFFYWPEQRLIKREMRRGRSCRVLESRNPQRSAGGYSRVLSWIDLESSSLIRAEAYDDQNRLLKEFHPGAIAKVNGRMQLKQMEIRNLQKGSRTQIEFDFD